MLLSVLYECPNRLPRAHAYTHAQFSRQNMKNKHSGLYLIAPSEENDPPCVQA